MTQSLDTKNNFSSSVLLSVVVPVHNEEDNILPLLTEIQAALSTYDYEIIYVNDGSTDNTSLRLAEAKRQLGARLRVVHHQVACGQSTAIYSGVQAARGVWIATLDGDGQNDPADLPLFLQEVLKANRAKNLQMVAGMRAKRQDRWIRRISSQVANAVRNYLLQDNTPDTGCGLKLFSREIFLKLPYFDHMHRFLPALVKRHGGQVVSLRVNHRPRLHGRSHYGVLNRLWVGIVDILGVMWLQRRTRLPVIVTQHALQERHEKAEADLADCVAKNPASVT